MNQQLSNDDLKQRLVAQIEYYFSPENLARDAYLNSNLDSDGYAPLTLIAQFKKVSSLTADLKFIVESLETSKFVILDETKTKIKGRKRAARNTILLREIPSDEAIRPEVAAIFADDGSGNAPVVKNLKVEYGNNWVATFEDEDTALYALNWLRTKEFRGEPIRARMKSESARSYYVAPTPSAFYPGQQQQPGPQQVYQPQQQQYWPQQQSQMNYPQIYGYQPQQQQHYNPQQQQQQQQQPQQQQRGGPQQQQQQQQQHGGHNNNNHRQHRGQHNNHNNHRGGGQQHNNNNNRQHNRNAPHQGSSGAAVVEKSKPELAMSAFPPLPGANTIPTKSNNVAPTHTMAAFRSVVDKTLASVKPDDKIPEFLAKVISEQPQLAVAFRKAALTVQPEASKAPVVEPLPAKPVQQHHVKKNGGPKRNSPQSKKYNGNNNGARGGKHAHPRANKKHPGQKGPAASHHNNSSKNHKNEKKQYTPKKSKDGKPAVKSWLQVANTKKSAPPKSNPNAAAAATTTTTTATDAPVDNAPAKAAAPAATSVASGAAAASTATVAQ